MPKRRIYPRPPIVEAIIELRFEPRLAPGALATALGVEIGDRYQGERKHQERIQLTASVAANSLSTHASRAPHVHFLTSDDGLRLLGCGEGSLSVHVLAPYPGWESFIEQTQEAVAALPSDLSAGGFSALAVRYLDRITLPTNDPHDLSAYFTCIPQRPPEMPRLLRGFHYITQSLDPNTNTLADLRIASAPATPNGAPVVVWDLCLTHDAATQPIPITAWLHTIEDLHTQQRNIFEGTITDRTRRLFT